jgi:hypothetical protein
MEQIKIFTDNAVLIKHIDSISINNTPPGTGTAGYVPRGANKIIVGSRGLEYLRALEGIMSNQFFKEAVRLLTEAKAVPATDTAKHRLYGMKLLVKLRVPLQYDSLL